MKRGTDLGRLVVLFDQTFHPLHKLSFEYSYSSNLINTFDDLVVRCRMDDNNDNDSNNYLWLA